MRSGDKKDPRGGRKSHEAGVSSIQMSVGEIHGKRRDSGAVRANPRLPKNKKKGERRHDTQATQCNRV